MTSDNTERAQDFSARSLSRKIGSLLQVVHELEGLLKLSDVVPPDLLWNRPPGLPSGAELLWLLHLVDDHVFAAGMTRNPDSIRFDQPDYAGLLAAHPCSAGTLDELVAEVTSSREQLTATLEETAGKIPSEVVDTIVATVLDHDRRVLSALTERLYESGLGT